MAQRLKRSTCPKWIFSQKTTNKISMYLLAPFILQNLKKILRADPELWGCAIFRPKMTHSSWTIFFWYKPLLLLSFTYCSFSLCTISKNSYRRSRGFGPKMIQRIQSYEHAQFLGPKWPISSMRFFQKTC